MSYDDLFLNEADSSEDNVTDVDPRDSYGDRFQVTERNVTDPKTRARIRLGIIPGYRHFKSSDRLFSRHHGPNAGGQVNMKNVQSVTNDVSGTNNQDSVAKDTNIENNNSSYSNKDNFANSANKQVSSNNTNHELSDFRSAGLDSLFTSTVKMVNEQTTKHAEVKQEQQDNHKEEKVTSTKEENVPSYNTKDTSKPASFVNSKNKEEQNTDTNRFVNIIKPVNFDLAASEISGSLKNGDAIVLYLRNTNFDLSKRLLDFSFGAASMCGAMVSLDGDRTYVFTIGSPLTHEEKLLCAKEGVSLNIK